MKLKNAMALGLASVLAVGLTACGSSADISAAESTVAAADAAGAPDGDGDPTTLTVAMECAYAPYNWTQGDDSNGAVEIRGSSDYAYGYDVMMAKKIGEALGQKVQIVKLDWDSLIPAVMSGDVDCVIAGQSITAERAAQVDFSDPYYYASIITLTKKDSAYANAASVADLAGATATSQLGTIWYDTCLPQIRKRQHPARTGDGSRHAGGPEQRCLRHRRHRPPHRPGSTGRLPRLHAAGLRRRRR